MPPRKKNLTIGGERIRFWVHEGGTVTRPALLGITEERAVVLEDPATRRTAEEYPERELERLWKEAHGEKS